MIDPDDYSNAIEDACSTLFEIRSLNVTELYEARFAIRELTDVLDHLKDLQDELVEAEGLLDPDGWYTG